MISIMEPTKPGWIGLVLSTRNYSCNPEFVQLPLWYRPLHSLSGIVCVWLCYGSLHTVSPFSVCL